jgi:hypothetical protein
MSEGLVKVNKALSLKVYDYRLGSQGSSYSIVKNANWSKVAIEIIGESLIEDKDPIKQEANMVQIPQPASSEMIGQNDWENLSE